MVSRSGVRQAAIVPCAAEEFAIKQVRPPQTALQTRPGISQPKQPSSVTFLHRSIMRTRTLQEFSEGPIISKDDGITVCYMLVLAESSLVTLS